MKEIILSIALVVSLFSCKREVCPEGINLQPMYGKIQKCKKQIEADKQFINVCKDQYGSMQAASNEMLRYAWKHYSDGNLELSMKRFNQAWLLDSLNADVYKGFASIQLDRFDFEEAIRYFQVYTQLNAQNAEVWKLSGMAYLSLYDKNKDKKNLELSIDQLNKSLKLNPSDAVSNSLITKAYAYIGQPDSARKYMRITDKLNPNIIEGELREYILR